MDRRNDGPPITGTISGKRILFEHIQLLKLNYVIIYCDPLWLYLQSLNPLYTLSNIRNEMAAILTDIADAVMSLNITDEVVKLEMKLEQEYPIQFIWQLCRSNLNDVGPLLYIIITY